MEPIFVADQTYRGVDFKENPLPKGEYENCSFAGCDFSNVNLAGLNFIGCKFTGCNLSLAALTKTAFQRVQFKDCKMLGLRFEACNPFGLSSGFENCGLNHSSFYRLKVKQTVFKNCQLQETDFTEADLTGAVFDHCDLARATFARTVLEKADFRTAYHYSLDPEANRIRKARFSLPQVVGLLGKYDIQIEETHE
jgi:uncharacterized protein YjbI with pentapeptide repeats